MRVMVAGREGQVARALRKIGLTDGEVICCGRPEVDVTDCVSIDRMLHRHNVDVVINAAAYTAVDRAESDEAAAFAVNAQGAFNVAKVAADHGLPVIQISTDYVFSGAQSEPYRETDQTGPLGVYGRSKLEGERMVMEANPAHAIIRTAWVYSADGSNFLKTMLRLAQSRDEIGVVDDQFGNPTYAQDLAEGILAAAQAIYATTSAKFYGVFHLAGTGDTTWAGFAEHIFHASKESGGAAAKVTRIGTADFPTPARRPGNSRLNCTLFSRTFGFTMPDWHMATERCVAELLAAADSSALDSAGPSTKKLQ